MVHPGQTLESGSACFWRTGTHQQNQRIDGTVALILGQRHGEIASTSSSASVERSRKGPSAAR